VQTGPKGDPLDVNVHDFKDKELGKVVPHGIYDPTTNAGWVSVGITHDTAEFAVQLIRTWLDRIGRPRYTSMRELMITVDCGGSNSVRSRLWKVIALAPPAVRTRVASLKTASGMLTGVPSRSGRSSSPAKAGVIKGEASVTMRV
jgi:hypothetical protein